MIPNRRLLVAYIAPYFAYVLIASVAGRFVPIEVNYLLRIIAASLLLLWAKRWFFSFKGPKSPFISVLSGIAAGFIGLVLWIALLNPFMSAAETRPWSSTAFVLRLLAAGLLVPIFEEVFTRGFVFRFALQWEQLRRDKAKEALETALDERSVNESIPGDWSWGAMSLSTLVFALGHSVPEWPAAVAYGLLMAGLYIWRKDLLSCIVAHSVTNIALALYVYQTGKWQLW